MNFRLCTEVIGFINILARLKQPISNRRWQNPNYIKPFIFSKKLSEYIMWTVLGLKTLNLHFLRTWQLKNVVFFTFFFWKNNEQYRPCRCGVFHVAVPYIWMQIYSYLSMWFVLFVINFFSNIEAGSRYLAWFKLNVLKIGDITCISISKCVYPTNMLKKCYRKL